MQPEVSEQKRLTSLLIDEIFNAFRMSKDGWARRNLWPLFWLPAHLFTKFSLGFDEIVEKEGFDAAARWVLPRFIKDSVSFGKERIPKEGPLLIAANHPGSVDALVIASNIQRPDFSIIISSIPFLMNLPEADRHFIHSTADTFDRMAVLRSSVEHLQRGGAMLIYPSGHVDPDPNVLPGAREGLGEWSRSVELLMRKVPQTKLVIAIISHLVGKSYYQHPLIKLQRGYREKQKLAEFIQMMQQMVVPGSVNVVPRVSFDFPLSLEQLSSRAGESIEVMQSIVARARRVLTNHVSTNFEHLERSQA